MALLHPDRLFPADPDTRAIARRLYAEVAHLPILSPHGHTQARWFADNQPFPDPATLFILPDHYVYRMLYSQGDISLEQLGLEQPGAPAPHQFKIHAPSGDSSPNATSSSAALPHASGSTTFLKICSGLNNASPPPTPTSTTTPSPQSSPPRPSCPALFMRAPTSRCSQPQIPRPIRSPRTSPCAPPGGKAACSQPSAPMPALIPTSPASTTP
jgi:hypothetical protein